MRLSIFKSVYDAWVFDTADGEWSDMATLLTELDQAPQKEQVLMFNFCKFLPVGVAEEGRKYHYKNGQKLSTFDYIPNTVRRCSHNVEEIYGVVLDFDGGMTMEEAIDEFIDYDFVIYTTWRHTPEKNRFRLVIPFSQPLKGSDVRLRKEAMLEAFPAIDPASLSMSQSFYFHSGQGENIAFRNPYGNKMIDPYSFEERHPVVHEEVEREEISDLQRERWIDVLSNIRLVETNTPIYYQWTRIGWAMKNEGFSLGDFQYVTQNMTRQKTSDDCATIWANSYEVDMGYVYNLVTKQYGIKKEDIILTREERDLERLQERLAEKYGMN